jgi:hypothetical protein
MAKKDFFKRKIFLQKYKKGNLHFGKQFGDYFQSVNPISR